MTTNLEERARELARLKQELYAIDELCGPRQYDDVTSVFMRVNNKLARVQAEARERLAAWMIEHSFATGHGDTFEDLLKELSWQVKELRQRQAEALLGQVEARDAALEEAAKLAIAVFGDTVDIAGRMAASAIAKRIRLAQAAAPAMKEG